MIKMKNSITVKELMEQLQTMVEGGYGNHKVWFRDECDVDHEVEKGVYDESDKDKAIVLG